MYTTYVLQSKSTGRFYTGSTSDFETRFQRHNCDSNTATKNQGPWELKHREDFDTRAEAMARERYFKTGAGRDRLKQIITRSSPE